MIHLARIKLATCEADVIATRPQVLLQGMVSQLTNQKSLPTLNMSHDDAHALFRMTATMPEYIRGGARTRNLLLRRDAVRRVKATMP